MRNNSSAPALRITVGCGAPASATNSGRQDAIGLEVYNCCNSELLNMAADGAGPRQMQITARLSF